MIYFRFGFSAVFIAFLVLGFSEAEEPMLAGTDFSAGQTVEIEWPGLIAPIRVWLPRGYDKEPDRRWPLMLWYHGTNGQPTIEPVWGHSRESDWIIVGMTYRQGGTYQGDEENIAAELEICRAVRGALSKVLRLQPERQFIGGFSKGGWVSAMLLKRDPTLAGGLIMGAGVLNEDPPVDQERGSRSIFIGIGEKDGNRAMSHRAARTFRMAPYARVTVEIWEGLGHSVPEEAESLRQWLAIEGIPAGRETSSTFDPITTDALEWFDGAFSKLRRSTEPASNRYFELQRLSRMPFFGRLDDESREAAFKLMRKLAGEPGMKEELAAEQRYREILDRESRDRLLGTLVTCHQDYRRLAESAPETRFGQAADHAAARTGAMIPGQ